jgi:glycine cleavage system H protein
MVTPKELRYAKTHEWVRVEGEQAYVGITDYAQEELGDIVYVEPPEVGSAVKKDQEVATIESVKAASPIYAPVSGSVERVNPKLEKTPELVNQKPYEAFLFVLKLADPSELAELMEAAAYERHVQQEKAKG